MTKLNINPYNNESKWYNKPFNGSLLFSEEKDFYSPTILYVSTFHIRIFREDFSVSMAEFSLTLCLLNDTKTLHIPVNYTLLQKSFQ